MRGELESRHPPLSWSLALATLASCLLGTDPLGAEPLRVTPTDHLVLEWSEDPGPEEVTAVAAAAETLLAAVTGILGTEPAAALTVLLRGPAERSDGRREYPRVDSQGRVHLFTFSPGYESYLNPLAHELVHALRIDRARRADWFFEEGFAEFVALRADPSLAGFPWFDHPVDLVAGQWLARDLALPLTDLRLRHRELNLACRAQSYALRSAFFDWLGRTYGDDAVLEMAAQRPAGDPADYERFLSQPLASLEEAWRTWLSARYRQIPDIGQQTASFLESPIQYFRVCEPGGDF